MPSSASNSRIIDPDGQAAESGGRAGDVGSEKEEFISNGLVRTQAASGALSLPKTLSSHFVQ